MRRYIHFTNGVVASAVVVSLAIFATATSAGEPFTIFDAIRQCKLHHRLKPTLASAFAAGHRMPQQTME